MTPVLAGLAAVTGVFVLAGLVVSMRMLASRMRIRRRSARLQESEVTSLDWIYRVGPAQERGGRTPTAGSTSAGVQGRQIHSQPLPPESRPGDDRVDGEPTRREARRRPSEVLAEAERRAAEIEEGAHRNAEARRIEAERKATEVVAAAGRRAAELEESARRSAEATRTAAERKASATLTAAERKALELEESARASAGTALEEAQQKASEIVAQAERERIRLQNERAREQTLVEETRKRLSALLESVLADVEDEPAQRASRISELREARGPRG
jgi:flagellar biosynthesis GTPase FlhF